MKKEGYIKPIIVLAVICLVAGGLLGYVNHITDPIITEAAEIRAHEARKEALPEADTFTVVFDDTLPDEIPDGIDEVYKANNGAGYVFTVTGPGYGGKITAIAGIASDGTISGAQVLDHSETVGLGARITGEAFLSQFIGQDETMTDVDAISGSTISSRSFMNLMTKAFEAFEILNGGEG